MPQSYKHTEISVLSAVCLRGQSHTSLLLVVMVVKVHQSPSEAKMLHCVMTGHQGRKLKSRLETTDCV